jgi:hypothetical protein
VAANYPSLVFQPWVVTIEELPPEMVGRDMVVQSES